MTVLGMWSCQWRELKPISFGFGNATGQASNGPNQRADVDGSNALGHDRGRVVGGTGDYELVGINDASEQV
jgi:hypothetical protein